MNVFGDTVKKVLIDKHITQVEVALKIGIHKSSLNSLLNRNNISLEKMQEIADALDCDLVISLVPKGQEQEKTLVTVSNPQREE